MKVDVEVQCGTKPLDQRYCAHAGCLFRIARLLDQMRGDITKFQADITSISRRSNKDREISGVSESAMIGVAHPDFGEDVTAVVVIEETRLNQRRNVNIDEANYTCINFDDDVRRRTPRLFCLKKQLGRSHFPDYTPRGLEGGYLSAHPNSAATFAVFLWYSINTGHLSNPLGDATLSLSSTAIR